MELKYVGAYCLQTGTVASAMLRAVMWNGLS